MGTDADQAASSAATTEQTAPALSKAEDAALSDDYGAFAAAEREELEALQSPRKATDRAKEPAVHADSAPAKPAEQAPSTDGSPAPDSDSGLPPDAPAKTRARVSELLADRAKATERAERAERELAALKARPTSPTATGDAKPAAPSTATPTREDPEPTLEAFEADPERYPDPYASWQDAKTDWRIRQALAAERRAVALERTEERRIADLQTRIKAETDKDPAYLETVRPVAVTLTPTAVAKAKGEALGPRNVAADLLLEMPIPAAILRYWSTHPEALTELDACQHRAEVAFVVGRHAALAAAGTPETKTAPVVTPPKTLTDMPAPAETLGRRPTETADETDQAALDGDMARFMKASYREAVAGRI